MQFAFDPAHERFREEVRQAIAADLPAELASRQKLQGGIGSSQEDSLAWARILRKRNWSVPHWPMEHGGQAWSALEHFIFEEEQYAAFAPEISWAGAHMVGPTIYTFGSEELKEAFLSPIRDGAYTWAQGFSEPGAGSDLASLRTSAVLDGDRYIVNGQKIWTSGANVAKWGFFLVRTDPDVKPQRGISFLLIDLASPGITIRTIPQINGEADLCEVFLDNVEVPAVNLVGEAGKGWTYAKFLLDNERTASSFIYWNKREFRRTQAMADAEFLEGLPLSQAGSFQARLARIEAELTALEWSVLRVLADENFRYNTTAVASVLKLSGSALQQAITELQVDLIGIKAVRYFSPEPNGREPAQLWPGHVPGRTGVALGTRAATIFGGTMQVQKNIVAKLAFGL